MILHRVLHHTLMMAVAANQTGEMQKRVSLMGLIGTASFFLGIISIRVSLPEIIGGPGVAGLIVGVCGVCVCVCGHVSESACLPVCLSVCLYICLYLSSCLWGACLLPPCVTHLKEVSHG